MEKEIIEKAIFSLELQIIDLKEDIERKNQILENKEFQLKSWEKLKSEKQSEVKNNES